jgi:hypothetical protein
LFNLKIEPQTYEEMLASARWVRERLGVTAPPKPVTINPCPPPPKKTRINNPRTADAPPIDLRPLSEGAKAICRSDAMRRFIDRHYAVSSKTISLLLERIEYWAAFEAENKEGRPGWVKRRVRNFCHEHGVPAMFLYADCRIPEVVRLRNRLWAEIHGSPMKPSYAKIGRWFRRDHTTVVYAVKKHLHGLKHPMVIRKHTGHQHLRARMDALREAQRDRG